MLDRVGTYGKQLGQVSDALIVLVGICPTARACPRTNAVARQLEAMAAEIATIKRNTNARRCAHEPALRHPPGATPRPDRRQRRASRLALHGILHRGAMLNRSAADCAACRSGSTTHESLSPGVSVKRPHLVCPLPSPTLSAVRPTPSPRPKRALSGSITRMRRSLEKSWTPIDPADGSNLPRRITSGRRGVKTQARADTRVVAVRRGQGEEERIRLGPT